MRLAVNPIPRVGGESENDKTRAHALEMFLKERLFRNRLRLTMPVSLRKIETTCPALLRTKRKHASPA